MFDNMLHLRVGLLTCRKYVIAFAMQLLVGHQRTFGDVTAGKIHNGDVMTISLIEIYDKLICNEFI